MNILEAAGIEQQTTTSSSTTATLNNRDNSTGISSRNNTNLEDQVEQLVLETNSQSNQIHELNLLNKNLAVRNEELIKQINSLTAENVKLNSKLAEKLRIEKNLMEKVPIITKTQAILDKTSTKTTIPTNIEKKPSTLSQLLNKNISAPNHYASENAKLRRRIDEFESIIRCGNVKVMNRLVQHCNKLENELADSQRMNKAFCSRLNQSHVERNSVNCVKDETSGSSCTTPTTTTTTTQSPLLKRRKRTFNDDSIMTYTLFINIDHVNLKIVCNDKGERVVKDIRAVSKNNTNDISSSIFQPNIGDVVVSVASQIFRPDEFMDEKELMRESQSKYGYCPMVFRRCIL